MSPRDQYASLLALVEELEEIRSAFQDNRRNDDDPTGAHRKLVEALTILHSTLSDLETPPHDPRA